MLIYKKRFLTKRWKIRVRTAWKILTGQYKHWVLVDTTDENFIKAIKDETFNCNYAHSGTVPYIYYKMLKRVADAKSEDDMILDKATWQANGGYID
jgi:hypothetical protein